MDTKTILATSLITHQILEELERHRNDSKMSVKDLISSIENEYGIENISIMPLSFLLGNMYIVVNSIQEIYIKNDSRILLETFQNQMQHMSSIFTNLLPYNDLQKLPQEIMNMKTQTVIRRMRNAISHMNYIQEKTSIRFWDCKCGNNQNTFEVVFSYEQMRIFYNAMVGILTKLSTESINNK